jgi:hypothetical protein
MNTKDSAAFTSACAITPQNYSYKIAAKGSLSCTIDNLLNDANPISFKDEKGNPQFSIDFTNQTPWNTSTPAIKPQPGAEVVATYAGGSTSPSWTFTLADAAATETITITNTTGYALQLTGLQSGDSPTFGTSCNISGSVPYTIASTVNSCEVSFTGALPSDFSAITGVSGATTPKSLFAIPMTDLATGVTLPNAKVTASGASPAYTLTISPQTVSIQNNSATDVYMNVNSYAFATGPTYTTGKGYLIGKNTTFKGTIQNLLNEPSANPGLVSFNDVSGTPQFTIDFTNQTPWVAPGPVTNSGTEVTAAYTGSASSPDWAFTLAEATAATTITINNSTGYALQLNGLASNDNPKFATGCGTVSGPNYEIAGSVTSCEVSFGGSLPTDFIAITGVSTPGGITLFSYLISDLISSKAVPQLNAIMSSGGTSPSYTATFASQTISVLNYSKTDIYMNVSDDAFKPTSTFTPAYVAGKGYVITGNKGEFPAVINNLFNETNLSKVPVHN